MNINCLACKPLVLLVVCVILSTMLLAGNNVDAAEPAKLAFSEKFMFRLGSYNVQGADTSITILSSGGIGGGISFSDDLGGDTSDRIPRIDGYYRFNDKHRFDFSAFSISRSGLKTLALQLEIGDEIYQASETLSSEIKYSIIRLGYAYSFYRSPGVELSFSAGLNVTRYDFRYSLVNGDKSDSSGVTSPLPVFGLHMSYLMSPKWSLIYVAEYFFIEIDNKLDGTLFNGEIDIEYRLFDNFALGAGFVKLLTDVDVDKKGWRGSVTDSYSGYLLYGSFYF